MFVEMGDQSPTQWALRSLMVVVAQTNLRYVDCWEKVTVFSVGVTTNVDIAELNVIASTPSCLYVYLLSSFTDVAAFTDQIMSMACRGQ